MKRAVLITFAILAYTWFLVDIVWAIAFLADLGPLGMDHDPRTATAWAVIVNLSLLVVFAAHHSLMARDGAKRLITRVIPAAAERSTYVFAASALLALVLWQWRPISGSVWDVSAQPWQLLLWVGYGLGWVIAVAATFMIDHADFVGLRQAASRPAHYRPPVFREQWLYAWVRHPLMLGLLMAFWFTPRMSWGHLVFAAAFTAYIGIGIGLEEADLRRRYGSSYTNYAGRVPALIPRPGRATPPRSLLARDRDDVVRQRPEGRSRARRYRRQERRHGEAEPGEAGLFTSPQHHAKGDQQGDPAQDPRAESSGVDDTHWPPDGSSGGQCVHRAHRTGCQCASRLRVNLVAIAERPIAQPVSTTAETHGERS